MTENENCRSAVTEAAGIESISKPNHSQMPFGNQGYSEHDAIEQFKAAMEAAGIIPPADLVADGKIHRCNTNQRNGKGDAAYQLHLDGISAGGFQNWQEGEWQKWRMDIGRPLTRAEKDAYAAKSEAMRRQYEADQQERHAKAREAADRIWQTAQPAPDDYPYLQKKGVRVYGIKVGENGHLVIPLLDTDGVLHSLQSINADGKEKRFLPGGRKNGCYFLIGEPDGKLCIAEGYATGASIHEATGHAVAIAFDCGNLLPVARTLREKYPDLRIILCADDDYKTEGNPGKTKAQAAAQAVNGWVALPDFGDNRPEGATDFNDLHQAQGVEAVRRCIDSAMPPPPPETFSFSGGEFKLKKDGVYSCAKGKDGEELPPRWICSPLKVLAKTRDGKSHAWGRLLEWPDDDGVLHRWAMPLDLLQGDCVEVRAELARRGLRIAPSKAGRDLLASYIQTWPVEARARCVDRLGWHGAVFVTPSEPIGNDDELVVFQNSHAIEPALSVAGTAEEWRDHVGALAAGNSRLVFAISCAFAGTLADIAGEDSGGFHFRGGSSTGKTTALKVAASVWGDPLKYTRLWRATANGLEGLAAMHNDGLLILDELSQVDPKEAGEAAYMLANGQGKARASRTGAARQAARWRLLFLSSGEESLTALMARAGKRPNAGQEVRLADIDADAGAGMGAFEELHDLPSPAGFADALKDAAVRYHGAVGLEWLRRVVADKKELPGMLKDGMSQFVAERTPKGATGQAMRVARRFGLVAVAGELATHYGLTGWVEGEAATAAQKCFAAWLEGFGETGCREDRALLAQVRAFFEAHGNSRFESMESLTDQKIINRAGFYRKTPSGEREYLVLSESFRREVCAGHEPKRAAKILLAQGWLAPGADGRATQKVRLPGMGPTRCYVFTGRMWEDGE